MVRFVFGVILVVLALGGLLAAKPGRVVRSSYGGTDQTGAGWTLTIEVDGQWVESSPFPVVDQKWSTTCECGRVISFADDTIVET